MKSRRRMDSQAFAATEKTVFHEMIRGVWKDPVYTEGRFVHTPYPQQLVVELTAACNQGCIFCGRTYMDRAKRHMPRPIFDKIVDEMAEKSPYTELWPAFMGESMLLGDELFDRLRYARDRGCQKITLNTNGTLINERTVPRILEGNWDRLIVSCDAHTPETHARVRPGRRTEGLAGIYRGVHLLIEQMRAQGLSKPLIEMQFSIFAENEKEAEAFVKYWLSQGVVVKTRPKVYWSGLVQGGDPRVTIATDRTPCLWSMDTACIHWNGNVVMCALDSDGKYVAGNLEVQTLGEIWNGPLKWVRELHMRKRFADLPEICRRCPDWQVKRAQAYFPNDAMRQAYEAYVQMGRVFMERHPGAA